MGRPPRPYITEQEKADRAEQRSLMGSPCSPAHRSRPGSMRGSLVSSPAHRSGTNSPANRASINSPAHRAGTSSPGRRGSTSSPAHRSSTSSPSHRSATSSPTPSGTGSRGGKIYSTRGMGWRGGRGRGRGRGRGGKRGRGRGKRKKSDDEVDWKKKNMNGANKIRHNNHNDGRVPSRRRARMGQGAYDELEYALLKMQFSTEEVYDEEDEWGELRQEESWGATLGEARRKLKEEMKEEEDDAWQSRVEEDEDAEQENFKEEATPTDQDSNSNSFSNLAIKSLQLGTKKLDVIILDGLEDAPDEAEEEYHASPFEVNKINSHNDQTSCNSSAAKSVEMDEADTEHPDDDNDSGQASCSSTSQNQWEHENNEKETTVEM